MRESQVMQFGIPLNEDRVSGVLHYQHKLKCLNCSLHFVVCSDHESWPDNGKGHAFCPECGGQGPFLSAGEPVESFIFEVVPGNTQWGKIIGSPAYLS